MKVHMAASPHRHKRSPGFYLFMPSFRVNASVLGGLMLGLALAMFIALFAFGGELLGWRDPSGHIQLGLFAAFLFGIICGYRTRG
jgi:hypothetical protein